ncbi:heat intolerant 4-like protein [Tanacetum coccineum]|uniref:Heat intolerant 4-like protein n=1 Tax=Tanacetum coccineum TaxID=301880 RepID=A0ABQ5BR09_9ASTR
MKNKGTKRKAEQKQHESTEVVRRKTKHSKPQLEPEFFHDQRELEDLWKHAYPVGTELDRLDKLYKYNWNFSNLEEAFDEGGVLHGEKVYLFVCTEAPIERADILIPTVIAVVSPFPPSDKIGLISVQRESESRKVVDMKQMKMDWVPYVPLGQRSALVERLKSQIFVLSCVQRRAGLKLLKDERVAEFTYCIPYFYNPFEEDETKESTIVELLYPVEPPIYCEFDWEFDEVEEYTNNLIAEEELSEDQKDAFKEFLKENVQERKRANREARQKRKQALKELSQEKLDAINNTRFYKFYPLEAPDNTVMPKVVEATGKTIDRCCLRIVVLDDFTYV